MKPIIAKINFSIGNKKYIIGDEVDIDNISLIKKFNENGFIEPLDYEDLILLERKIKKENKSEEEKL